MTEKICGWRFASGDICGARPGHGHHIQSITTLMVAGLTMEQFETALKEAVKKRGLRR